jgi:hypothetical protein
MSIALDRVTAPEKKGSRPNPQYNGRPIHGFIPSFSPKATIEAMGVKPPLLMAGYKAFTGSITPTCE